MLRIDIAFDLICPWCLIGKRQLMLALDQFRRQHPETPVQLNWHAVQLLPQLPADGVPFAEFYRQRLGNQEAVSQRQAQVRAVAAPLGLTINFDKIKVMPNTARAHALLAAVAERASATDHEALLDRLFTAYFVHGENIGDPETLSVIAQDWGLSPTVVAALIAAGGPLEASRMGASHLGAQGVPYFVFNEHYALSGAQPASVLLAHMEAALATGKVSGGVAGGVLS